jgi:hypothetical protein
MDSKWVAYSWEKEERQYAFFYLTFSLAMPYDAADEMARQVACNANDDRAMAECARKLAAVKAATGKTKYFALGYPSALLTIGFQRTLGETNAGSKAWYGCSVYSAEIREYAAKMLTKLAKHASFMSQPDDVLKVSGAVHVRHIHDTDVYVAAPLVVWTPAPEEDPLDVVREKEEIVVED